MTESRVLSRSEPARQPGEARPSFRIYMVGPAWIEWQGRPLAVCRRQARGLLYRLAAHVQPVPRDELCFAFWPDTAEAAAHRHLSHVLCHLRDCLPAPDMLRGSSELIELDPAQVWCDARVLRATCAVLDSQPVEIIEQMVSLYRGPFLAGFSLPNKPEFELWLAQQRSVFERMYLDCLEMLMASEAKRGEYARAVRYARQYLAVDDVAEGVHRRLMVMYAMLGDRPGALQQYGACAAALQSKLGLSPLPETQAVYQAILQT